MKQLGPHIEDKLLDFSYGELGPAEAHAIEVHLEGCPACTDALESIQGVRRVMSRLPVEAAPEQGFESLIGYAEQAARRISAGPAPKRARWMGWLIPAVGVSAVAVVVVVMAQTLKPETAEMVDRQVSTAAGARPAPAPMNEMSGSAESPPPPPQEMAKALAQAPEAPKAVVGPSVREPVADVANGREEAAQFYERDKKSVKGGIKSVPTGLAHLERIAKADQGEDLDGFRSGGAKEAEESQPADTSSDDYRRGAVHAVKDEEARKSVNQNSVGAVALGNPGAKSETAGQSAFGSGLGGASPAHRSAAADAPAKAPSTPAPVAAATPPVLQRFDEAQATRSLAAAPAEKKAKAQEPDTVDVYERQADSAHTAGKAGQELAYLKDAVAAAHGQKRADLLARLCGVEETMGASEEDCDTLQREFPNSPATTAVMARRARAKQAVDAVEAAPKAADKAAKPAVAPTSNTQNGL